MRESVTKGKKIWKESGIFLQQIWGIRRLALGGFSLERSRRKSGSKREEEQNRRDGSQGFRLVLGVGAASLKSSTPCCRGDFQVWLLWVSHLCHLSCFSHLFLKWFLHCLLGCYGLVIVALIFLFSGSIKEIFDYASVYCFILEELAAFCAFLLRHLPWISPLIIKPMDKIMKWVQHIWWMFYALLLFLVFCSFPVFLCFQFLWVSLRCHYWEACSWQVLRLILLWISA